MSNLFSSSKPKYAYRMTRHAYKKETTSNAHSNNNFSFEQSLDVYLPEDNNANTALRNVPVIVLVMGSGWLGHVPWIYLVTNWWNSGGPKQIASQLGYPCISVRHSGGFIHVVPASTILMGVVAVLWGQVFLWHEDASLQDYQLPMMASFVGIFVIMALLKWVYGPGANLDGMVQDVDDALRFIQEHRQELLGDAYSTNESLVLGGYSSGAHVAATWLAKQQDQETKQTKNIVGVLYVSGVLSLDSWVMQIVVWTVFGPSSRPDIFSPVDHVSSLTCNVPKHLLVGCRYETFGIPVLDATFCSLEYVRRLKALQQEESKEAVARYVPILYANHWTILDSCGLVKALEEHLPWLVSLADDTNNESKEKLAKSSSPKDGTIDTSRKKKKQTTWSSAPSDAARTSSSLSQESSSQSNGCKVS